MGGRPLAFVCGAARRDPDTIEVVDSAERPEVALARRLLEGDSEAFTPFVESFQSKIFQYTWLMCGHREDAEEVAQDTLMKVFESFDQLKDPQNVRSWVFRIAKNYCLMKRRKSVFAPEREYSLDEALPGADGSVLAAQVVDTAALPDQELLRGELRTHLFDAIRELPDSYRSVLLLRDREGLSTSETAEILDLSEDVVKQRLHRARIALRKSLSNYVAK